MRKEVDGMGTSEIKYGDSICYIQHVDTGLWLTYQSVDVKSARMGSIQRKVRSYMNIAMAAMFVFLNYETLGSLSYTLKVKLYHFLI